VAFAVTPTSIRNRSNPIRQRQGVQGFTASANKRFRGAVARSKDGRQTGC
jgi:hypothetical protein